MSIKVILRATILTVLSSLAIADSTDDARVAALAERMAGDFDTHAPGVTTGLPIDQRLIDSRKRVSAPALGEYVLYLQLNHGADLALYRQRILILTIDDETAEVAQRAYSIEGADRFVDAAANDPAFAQLQFTDLTPLADSGCEQIWSLSSSPAGDEYVGIVAPERCRIISSRTGKPRRIGAVTTLTAHTLSVAERGFDDDGVQLFGSPPGESLLLYRIRP